MNIQLPFTEADLLQKQKKRLPDRYPQMDLFMCDIADAAVKNDLHSMEHPIFSLSTKPDTEVREYANNQVRVRVVPSAMGMATIHDKDILIFAISQIRAKKNAGEPYGKHVAFEATDFLQFSNRQNNGDNYKRLQQALTRLKGTQIQTNIATGGMEHWESFDLLSRVEINRKKADGRIVSWAVELSDWLFRAIDSDELLTMDRQYFQLRKPLERRLYEIGRKHCGRKSEWKIGLEKLYNKSGSRSSLKHFKYLLKDIVKFQHLPDYFIHLEGDMVRFVNRGTLAEADNRTGHLIQAAERLPDYIRDAARPYAGGWDLYMLEDAWRQWVAKKELGVPKNIEAAFIGFCKRYVERHGVAV